MATCNTEYFVGNGKVFVKPYSGAAGWTEVGDCERMAVETSQTFIDIYESCSGNNNIAAHVVGQTDWSFVVDTLGFDKANLARALYGTASVVTGASVVDEPMSFAGVGSVNFTRHPDVSAVVVEQGATVLTLGTHYTLDAKTGTITLISTASLTGVAPYALTATYTHAGYDKVAGATQNLTEYSFKLAGINKVTGKNVMVTVPRVSLNLAAVVDFLGSDKATFSMSGMVLPDSAAAVGDSQYVTIQKVTT